MHISSITIVEGELAFADIYQHFADRMHLLPAYRRKLAQVPFNVAHPTWEDDPDFDLSNHLLHHAMPEGTSLPDAIDAAVTLNEPLLDRSRPLWQTYVISGVPGQTLILHQTHHCMIDGASGVELLAIIYDFEPDPAPPPPVEEPWQPEPPSNPAAQLGAALRENMQALGKTDWQKTLSIGTQSGLLQRAARVVSDFVTNPVMTAPWNAGLVGPHRRLAWTKQSFGEIREIRRALGGTINDVVLTVVSGAIADYLEGRGEDTADKSIRIMCPVNVRTEDQQGSLGNQVSAIFPILPAWTMPETQRLTTVVAETQRIKQNQEAQALTLLQESAPEPWPVAMWANQLISTPLDPTALAARFPMPVLPAGVRPPNVGYNFVCTNVPASQVPQYILGHKITDQIGLLILTGNVGFSVTILSYNQELFFGFISEPRLMPDVEKIAANVDAAFNALLDAARAHSASLTKSE